MHIRSLSATLALVGLLAIACDDGTQEQSPGEVLARDSTLARGLQQADTSSFADTVSARPAPRRMRPVPATIHPDPLPSHPLPPAPARTSSSPSGVSPRAKAKAAEILQQVPGATLPSAAVRPRGSAVP
jgi:hypothetical protein